MIRWYYICFIKMYKYNGSIRTRLNGNRMYNNIVFLHFYNIIYYVFNLILLLISKLLYPYYNMIDVTTYNIIFFFDAQKTIILHYYTFSVQ